MPDPFLPHISFTISLLEVKQKIHGNKYFSEVMPLYNSLYWHCIVNITMDFQINYSLSSMKKQFKRKIVIFQNDFIMFQQSINSQQRRTIKYKTESQIYKYKYKYKCLKSCSLPSTRTTTTHINFSLSFPSSLWSDLRTYVGTLFDSTQSKESKSVVRVGFDELHQDSENRVLKFIQLSNKWPGEY